MDVDRVLAIVEKHSRQRGAVISILEEVQMKYGYLPAEALKVVAEGTGRSLVDVYGLATFYRAFTLKPRGAHLCTVCLGTACHVRGAPAVAEEFEKQLGIKAGETTPDKELTLETVNCLGACALGPVVVTDGRYSSSVRTSRVKGIIEDVRAGLDKVDVTADPRVFPLTVSCPRCNHTLMDADHPIDGFPSIRVNLSFRSEYGWLRLSSLYGSYTSESEHDVPLDTVVDVVCPHCHEELKGAPGCPDCRAPMALMIVCPGGVLQVCSRRGCKGHMLDLS